MPRNVLSIRFKAFLLSSAGDAERVLTFHEEVRSQVGAMRVLPVEADRLFSSCFFFSMKGLFSHRIRCESCTISSISEQLLR